MPHLEALLEHLTEEGIPYCVASSGTFERLSVALSALGLSERFTSVFSAEQVARGKPEPDLFLFAANRFGVPPEACLVIEDSPFGVRAARAANMKCIGFVGGSHLQEHRSEHAALLIRHGADKTVSSLGAFLGR
jgi:HAD superfamily hydrolase (TIGR01509 family)